MIKQLVHEIVRSIRLESVLSKWGHRFPILKKMVPLHMSYPEGTLRTVTRNKTKFTLDISDYMQWHLYVHETDFSWQQCLKYVRSNSLVLDIGANVGQFALTVANHLTDSGHSDVSILAFEPNPLVFKRLEANLNLNAPLKEIVFPFPIALGETEGEMPFIFSMRNSGAGRLTTSGQEKVYVKMKRVIDFLQEFKNTKLVSFIKIDVEGFEPEVLNGALALIRQHRPTMYIEFSPSWYKARQVDGFKMLRELHEINYRLSFEWNDQFVSVSDDFGELESVYQTNILAIPGRPV